ncbi:hypothetical protein BO78DRAFT_103820 [Aspergillus sclerotiicarbonarius CBS 121057]|uniref:Rhodopsin domain-containing protein n=1 Tax=Aspergillus sclerotiicarbonarius (strain CBS 121057 / IBT 28362) TaxID=1448318 RepID=A0A319EAF1_ASPSB|nr:hypothetical protein BO78DRAFT_103820 [Aspergillus sclerotiicarbonarius CBS 121057]
MDWAVLSRDAGGTPPMTITVRIIVLVLAIPTTLVCGLRLYMRKFVLRSWGLDDWMVMLALIMVNGFSAIAYTITYYGLGVRTKNVEQSDILIWWKIYYAALCSYLPVAAAVKTSLTLFIMRLFPTRGIKIAGRCILGFVAIFTISGTLALAFQCRPFRAGFDKSIADAKCYSVNTSFAILMMQGVIMFVVDVIILALPIRCVWQLQMPRARRVMILGLFCIGFTACIAALVRFSTLSYATDETDYTYAAADSLIWMEVEFNLGLMSGSLSSLRKLIQLRPSQWSRNTSSFSGSRSTNLELGIHKGWGKGITKQTEIKRVFETANSSQELIAPIYGQGELCTTTKAFPTETTRIS